VRTYISLIRGINLGANKRVRMADLKALHIALGHVDPVTYIVSGNVVFQSDKPAAALSREIEERIASDIGHRVRVLVRSREEMARVVKANPFLPGADTGRLYVTFLADRPSTDALKQVEAPIEGVDPTEFRVIGREVYLHLPRGYGETKIGNAFWERRLGTAATTRNWNTVTRLLSLADR